MNESLPSDHKKYLARVFLDIVNADSVVFAFETARLYEMFTKYKITRINMMDAEKCTFTKALNELLKWKREQPELCEERQLYMKEVLGDIRYIAMGADGARLCSKFEASIIAAFDLVVVREKVEIFNPANPKGMNFSKDEIIYLDNGAKDSRSIGVADYKQISHSARLVNSRFIYVPHIIERFIEKTNEDTMKMLLGYLFPSSLPDGSLAAEEVVKSGTIDGIYKWLKTRSVSPFIYRVIGEQLFGSPKPNAGKPHSTRHTDAAHHETSHPIPGPMIIMKLRTSRVLDNEKIESCPDFIKFVFNGPSDQVAGWVNNAVNLWLEELKQYTRGFDIHIDLEAESHFMLHTFHKNIFDAMILGSEVESMAIDLRTNSLQFNMISKVDYESLTPDEKFDFSFTIPLVRGEVLLYLAILVKTTISESENSNWRGLRRISYNTDTEKESASLFTENITEEGKNKITKSVELSRDILKWAFTLSKGKESFEAKSLVKNRTIINQRISQNRLLNDKAMFMIKASEHFWTIDTTPKLPIQLITSENKTLDIIAPPNSKKNKKVTLKQLYELHHPDF